jgi:hypothetical protein
MVDSFINRHWTDWSDLNDRYKAEHGFDKGASSISLQSYIGSDLTIDMACLAKDIEERESFTNEYWIRSRGIQCIRNEEDRENNRIWSDVLGKFTVTKSGDDISFAWIEDESCLLKNTLIRDKVLYDRY